MLIVLAGRVRAFGARTRQIGKARLRAFCLMSFNAGGATVGALIGGVLYQAIDAQEKF
jgi:hypothetical protein